MRGRFWSMLLLAVSLVSVGCTRAKPMSAPSSAPAVDEAGARPPTQGTGLQFRLRQEPGGNGHAVPRPAFTATVDNCRSQAPMTQSYRSTLALPRTYVIDASELGLDLTPYRAAVDLAVRRAYQMGDETSHTVEDVLALETRPSALGWFTLRWEEWWERSTLEVVADGRVAASAPVDVLVSARLRLVSIRQEPCTSPSATPAAANLPLVADLRETPTMDVPAGSTPGSDEAMAIVLDYLGALAKGDARGAYALLHESYQKRVPYADYVQGYGPIVGIEIHAIEARQLDGYRDLVHAGVTISTTVHGQTRADDWLATFEVLVTRGRPPYQRSITQVAMERIEAE